MYADRYQAVWGLRMPLAQKLGVLALFSVGLMYV